MCLLSLAWLYIIFKEFYKATRDIQNPIGCHINVFKNCGFCKTEKIKEKIIIASDLPKSGDETYERTTLESERSNKMPLGSLQSDCKTLKTSWEGNKTNQTNKTPNENKQGSNLTVLE